MKLPNSWNNDGAYEQQLDFSANDQVLTCVQLPQNRFNYTSARAREPFVHPAHMDNLPVAERQYFEVVIKQKKSSVRVGLSQPGFCLHHPGYVVGLAPGSYGISDLGDIFVSGPYKEGAPGGSYSVVFEPGDVMGCGVRIKREEPHKKEVFFTWNGQLFGDPIHLPMFVTGPPMLLYPTVTLKGIGTEIEGIFGDDPANRPFRYTGN